MTLDVLATIAAFCAIVSAMILYPYQRWAATHLADVPNERSLHSRPAASGGGVVIAGLILLCSGVVWWVEGSLRVGMYIVGTALVTAIGWVDDRQPLPWQSRLLVQFAAAALAAGALWMALSEFWDLWRAGLCILLLIWTIWQTNAYNFMDGIDGLAGGQAVVGGIAWLILGIRFDSMASMVMSAAIMGSCLGFLLHNRPPASVFMGDAGSTTLGYSFAFLPVLCADRGPVVFLYSLIVMWPFVLDSSATLVRRVLRGQDPTKPHRAHYYQRMVASGWSHGRVASAYIAAASVGAVVVFVLELR